MNIPTWPPDNVAQTTSSPSRAFVACELGVLAGVLLLYVIARFFIRLHIGFIVVVAALALVYGLWRVRRCGRVVLRFWGLRLDNLWASTAVVGAGSCIAAAAIVLYWWLGRSRPTLPGSFYVSLPLYPAWGIVQQFLFQSLFHRDLQILTGRRVIPCLLTALAFGLLHSVTPTLAVATGFAGLFWSAVFTWRPNIIVLGISHGLLGGMFYYLVVGEDVVKSIL